jgi:hypothetical protein
MAINSHTADFLANYKAHIDTILAMPSGHQSPDPERLQLWVDSQASERRRNAAQALANEIRYFTHSDVIRLCDKIITEMYNDSEKPILEDKILKWFVGGKDKSSYFIGLICYHIAKTKGYRLPDIILDNNFSTDECEGSTIFYLDDMSYSASQLRKLLAGIRTRISESDIRVGLCVVTELAKNILETLGLGALSSIKIPNPFKRYYGEIVPDLKIKLGSELYLDCLLYFSAFFAPPCICYFDHKVADAPSTFLSVLMFGPVPPTKFNFKAHGVHHFLPKSANGKRIVNYSKDDCDKKIEHTQFIPFLSGCQTINTELLRQFETMPYEAFMMDSGFYESEIGNIPSEYAEAYKQRNSVGNRCPHSWYKNGYFQGGKTRRRNKRQATRKNRK